MASLTIDADMEALLRKQGFGLDEIPPQGMKLRLRTKSNLHTGGIRENVTHRLHPDNIAMAETIAKVFHLDAIGIDLITPDIGKAWHEIPCAIVEVNGNPGVSAEDLLERVLLEKFPAHSNGRIPSVLIVENNGTVSHRVAQHVAACGRRAGYTSARTTNMAGEPRFAADGVAENAGLPERILGLLLDPTCEALLVCCTVDDLRSHGSPPLANDLALIAAPDALSDDLRSFIETHSSQMIENVTFENVAERVFPAVTKLLGVPDAELQQAVKSALTTSVARMDAK